MTLSEPAAQIARCGAQQRADDDAESDRCHADEQRNPRGENHAAEKIAPIAIQAEEMLRLAGGAAQQVDAGWRAHFVIGVAVVDGIVGRDNRREDGHQQQDAQDRQSHLRRAIAQQMAQSVAPQAGERRRRDASALLGEQWAASSYRDLNSGGCAGPGKHRKIDNQIDEHEDQRDGQREALAPRDNPGRRIESTKNEPMPGRPNTDSVSTAPPSKAPNCRPMTVTRGSRALRMAWRKRTMPLAQALGSGGTNVVEAHHVEQVGACEPRDNRQRDGAQGDRGQDQVLDCVSEDIEPAGYQGVEREHIGEKIRIAAANPSSLADSRPWPAGVWSCRPSGGWRWAAGTACFASTTPKKPASSNPSQKTGIETPRLATSWWKHLLPTCGDKPRGYQGVRPAQ